MNLSNIESKITKHADKLGLAYGYLGSFAELGQWEAGDFWYHLTTRHEELLKHMNISKGFRELVPRIQNSNVTPVLKNALLVVLASYFLEGLALNIRQTKALETFGWNSMKGAVASAFVIGASESGSGIGMPTGSPYRHETTVRSGEKSPYWSYV